MESLTYYALIALAAVFQLKSVLPILGVTASISTPEMVGIAIAFFAVVVLANILGIRYGIKLMKALTVISLLGLVTAMVVLFTTPRAQIVSAVASLLPQGYIYQRGNELQRPIPIPQHHVNAITVLRDLRVPMAQRRPCNSLGDKG